MASEISVTLDDIKAARSAIGKYVGASPCVPSPGLGEVAGCELYLKMENLQRTRGPEAVEAILKAIAAKGYQARSFSFE
jgi:hypothetical protein